MRNVFIIVAFLPFVLAAGLACTLLRTGPHAFTEKQCRKCHAVTPVKGRRETFRLTAPVSDLCARCHKTQTSGTSHPWRSSR